MSEYIERSDAAVFFENSKQTMWHKDDIAATISSKKNIPSADVVEVVHGEWIITEEILETIRECSCCHCKTYYPKPLSFNVRKSPYCEDCGAKMAGSDINVTTNNGWISVDERLPERSGLYLVCGWHNNMYVTRFDAHENSVFNLHGHWCGKSGGRHFTHWQPLPEPPKGSD